MGKTSRGKTKSLAGAAKARPKQKYVLRLFIAGITPRSQRAIRCIKEICEQHLKDRYDLDIIDIYQEPQGLKGEQILVVPTLIKKWPLPLRRLIGDMTDKEKILVGLDLRPKA